MSVQVYEIYDAKLPYRNCQDMRPVIIINVLSFDLITVALISGAMDLYIGEFVHFFIDSEHIDFKRTGLKKKCYVAGNEIYTIKLEHLIRKRGCLSGGLLEHFQNWI